MQCKYENNIRISINKHSLFIFDLCFFTCRRFSAVSAADGMSRRRRRQSASAAHGWHILKSSVDVLIEKVKKNYLSSISLRWKNFDILQKKEPQQSGIIIISCEIDDHDANLKIFYKLLKRFLSTTE